MSLGNDYLLEEQDSLDQEFVQKGYSNESSQNESSQFDFIGMFRQVLGAQRQGYEPSYTNGQIPF